MYIYIESRPGLWTVGCYRPGGSWEPDSVHKSVVSAADRASYLNRSQGVEPENPPKHAGGMTIKEAYATLWEKLPEADLINIDIATAAERDKRADVGYSLYVGTADGCFRVEGRQSLEIGVADLLRKVRGDEPAPADLDAIHDQVSEL